MKYPNQQEIPTEMNPKDPNPPPLDLNLPSNDPPFNFDLNFPPVEHKQTQIIYLDSDDDVSPISHPNFVDQIDFWATADAAEHSGNQQVLVLDEYIPNDDTRVSPRVEEEDKEERRRLWRNASWLRRQKRSALVESPEFCPHWGEAEGETAGVFLDALKVVKRRGGGVHWVPMRNQANWRPERWVPKLKDLCLRVLEENAEEVESLEGMTDVMKEVLVSVWCGKRKMSKRLLGLYLRGSPVEVRVTDCSWIAEEDFQEILSGLNFNQLKVLQLDLCGRCMPDCVLQATLARLPNTLASLTTVSLVGAYRLSDDGLDALVTSAPLLSSVNLRGCSLLTSGGIISLAVKLKITLKELYLDDCQDVDAMMILRELRNLTFLETLSIARIQNVCDKFIFILVVRLGRNLKELALADCQNLTATSMRAIGENCPQLSVLDIRNLNQLNDFTLRHLATGCRSIQKLKLRGSMFSDEAVAAFLEASGGSLTELSLIKFAEVAGYTALAISRRCSKSLQILDLSFCRAITDGALGLIVDSCSNLRKLTLFGCTQITECFLNGHSNPHLKIIGLKGPALDQFKAPEFM